MTNHPHSLGSKLIRNSEEAFETAPNEHVSTKKSMFKILLRPQFTLFVSAHIPGKLRHSQSHEYLNGYSMKLV